MKLSVATLACRCGKGWYELKIPEIGQPDEGVGWQAEDMKRNNS
jgi:hypothetical protein